MASNSKNRLTRRICVVGSSFADDSEVLQILEGNFHLPMVRSVDGRDLIDDADVTFLCSDFIECANFQHLRSLGKSIIGPAYVKSRMVHNKPLIMPRVNRPLYSDSMAGVTVIFRGIPKRLCRKAVDLVHFLGGCAQANFSGSTTHFVTELASGKDYRIAVSLGLKIMHGEWLFAAWAVRDDVSQSVNSDEFMRDYFLESFCGLILYFVDYDEADTKDMIAKTLENKGKLAPCVEEASHVVVSNSYDSLLSAHDNQFIVSGEWFWYSIGFGYCANEALYSWNGRFSYKTPESSVESRSEDNLEYCSSSHLPDYSEQMLSPDCCKKPDKRFAICNEMLETEENYVKALNILLKYFKEPLELNANNPQMVLLTKAEVSQIFFKISALIEVHQEVRCELRWSIMHWKPNNLVGRIWYEKYEKMKPIYKAYISNYDNAVEVLDFCNETNPKFHAFLKATESRKECERNRISDLLVRPIQRLPSVVLLMKELLKKTDHGNPDYKSLRKAVAAIENILSSANDTRRQTESYAEIFRIQSDIEGFPPEIVSSARKFMGELHVISLGGEDEWNEMKGRRMALFLFNDVLEVTKERSASNENDVSLSYSSRRRTLTRQMSFLSIREPRKKYKHYLHSLLTSIRRIDTIAHDEVKDTFVISFRFTSGDNIWIAQSVTDDACKFLTNLAAQIFYICGRNTLTENTRFDVNNPYHGDPEGSAVIQKALQYGNLNSSAPKRGTRPRKHFRRVMSNIQIGLSNTLSRFHSRSNLSNIDEICSVSSSQSVAFPKTPTRNLRQIITSATFLPFHSKHPDPNHSNIN